MAAKSNEKSRDFFETRMKTQEIPLEIREINEISQETGAKAHENSFNLHESLTFPTFSAENQENIEISDFTEKIMKKHEIFLEPSQNLNKPLKNPCNLPETLLKLEETPPILSSSFENPLYFSPNPLENSQIRIEKYCDGSVYQGEFSNNLREGHGTVYFPEGGLYSGSWVCGNMQGNGTLFLENREKAYEGEWFQGKFQGNGTLFNENPRFSQGAQLNLEDFKDFARISEDLWVKYQGSFENHEKHGEGELQFVDGCRFIGNFVRNRVDGRGKILGKRGEIIFEGEWINNKLVKVY